MKILGIIPSRFASTRFPGKPLVMINGVSMIQRVYNQAKKSSSLQKVIVATDDERIYNHVKEFGGEVVMTSTDHPSGTDRCAEVLSNEKEKWDAVINIQGDEPFIDPLQIDLLASLLQNNAMIATLVKKIISNEELLNPNTPKVVLDKNGNAVYFSRQPLPYYKGVEMNDWIKMIDYYKHIGLYGYRSDILLQLTKLPVGTLEKAESLEQLRWLENGYAISTAVTDIETIAIDTPADLERLNAM
ncbi:MAG: 3-deoxy-manno-octulosonate cytidylyltransferase [Bacteroidota bacterium]